jgi:hypothetical protein
MANSNVTPEWESFAQSAQLALQGLMQAQMALAFLDDDERANRVSMQLHDVSEIVGAMQSDHSALVVEHEELQDLVHGSAIRGSLQGLQAEPLGENKPADHGRNRRLVIAWLRLRGLVPVVVAIGVIIAAASGMLTHSPGDAGSAAVATRSGPPGVAYLGDTISATRVSCTLLSATVDPAATRNRHHPPDSEYLTAHVQVRNTGTTFAHYDSSDFHMQVGTGNNMSEEPTIITSLGSGELAPGDSVGGDLVFNVRQGNRTVELIWSPVHGAEGHAYAWLLEL